MFGSLPITKLRTVGSAFASAAAKAAKSAWSWSVSGVVFEPNW